MRVGFAGTPEFAARALSAIHAHGHTIPIVLTQPDRPSGRGLALTASAVKRYATSKGLTVREPQTLKSEPAQATIVATPIDVLVVAAYGLILPRAVLAWPRHGCLNIHASRLPRWRGAAPIPRAIEAGDDSTGITIMQMDEGLDTGPIIDCFPIAIAPRETAGSLHDRLAELGARSIVGILDDLARGAELRPQIQPRDGITYAAKITAIDTRVEWTQSAPTLDRRIRALSPAPGAVARWEGVRFKIRAAIPLDGASHAAPGTIVAVGEPGIDIACGIGGGVLRLTELQPAAGRRMSARAFATGRAVAVGRRLDGG